jgi:hypothetical protein
LFSKKQKEIGTLKTGVVVHLYNHGSQEVEDHKFKVTLPYIAKS